MLPLSPPSSTGKPKKKTSSNTTPVDMVQLSLFDPEVLPEDGPLPEVPLPTEKQQLSSPASAAETSESPLQEDGADRSPQAKDPPIVPAMATWREPGMLTWAFAVPPQDLLQAIERCVDRLVQAGVSSRNEGFWQLVYLLCAKLYEEIQERNNRQFHADPREAQKPQGCRAILDRVAPLFEQVKRAYPLVFAGEDGLHLRAEVLGPLVAHLGRHTLLDTELDPFGAAYQQWAGAWAREWRAQYFTPLSVASFVVSLLQPQLHERVLDATCGAGVFFRALHAYRRCHVLGVAAQELQSGRALSGEECWKPLAQYMQRCVYGADLDRDLVRLARMHFVLLGGTSEHVYHMDSLHFPQGTEDPDVKAVIPLGSIDVIVGNPPFGLPITDPAILHEYELACVFKRQGSHSFQKTDRFQKKVPSEILFLEQALKWLKPGGRMGLVLNDGLLANPSSEYARFWLLKQAYLLASISLPSETFQAQSCTGEKTSVLLLRKMTEEERATEAKQQLDYSVYMAMVDTVGYDSRGRTVYKRTPEGSLVEMDGKRQVNNELPDVLADFWRFYMSSRIIPSPQDNARSQ